MAARTAREAISTWPADLAPIGSRSLRLMDEVAHLPTN